MKRYEVRTWSRVGHYQQSHQKARHAWAALKKHWGTLPGKCKRTVYRTVTMERF